MEHLEQPGNSWPSWAFSNHDVVRSVTRFANEDNNAPPQLAKLLIALLCSLRGTIFLYQGDELGLPEARIPEDIPVERMQDMCVMVRIGLCPEEQDEPQRLMINVELFVNVEDYLFKVDNDSIVDYSKVWEAIKTWEERPHTPLIETYLHELLDICFKDSRVQSCRVSITKPDIFEKTERAGVEVFMQRDDYEKHRT